MTWLLAAPWIAMGQTWSGNTESWQLTDTSAVLNADAAGQSAITWCSEDPPEGAFDWRVRWVQALAGSSSNRSTLRALSADGTELLAISLGTTGSEDPLELAGVGEFQPGVWAGGMDAEFRLIRSSPETAARWMIRPAGSWTYEELAAINGTPACWSLEAWFTASHTTDFSLHIHPEAHFFPDTLPPRAVESSWISDTLIRIGFDEPLAEVPTAWIDDTGLLCSFEADALQARLVCRLPGPMEPGKPGTWFSHALRDSLGNAGPCSLTALQLPCSAVHPGDVAITEIMADPTPSAGLPEMEWVEWTNFSSRWVDVRCLAMEDGAHRSEVVPLYGWDGMLEPGGRCVVSTVPERLQTEVRQAWAPDISTLTDAGEWLAVVRQQDGVVVDALRYERSWWQGAGGGHSAELQHAGACGLAAHWGPGAPASPGWGEETEGTGAALEVVGLWPEWSWSGGVQFQGELDPAFAGAMSWGDGAVPLVWESPHRARWEGQIPSGQPLALHATGLRSCTNRWGAPTRLSWVDSIGNFPQPSDLAVTELAVRPPTGWPGVPAFVEWSNASDHPLEVGGVTLNGETSPVRILPPKACVVVPLDLPNSGGSVSLLAADGTELEAFTYTACWGEDDGISWTRLDPDGPSGDERNWGPSTGPLGCSPGWLEPRVPWADSIAPVLLAWVERESQTQAYFSEAVSPIAGGPSSHYWPGLVSGDTVKDFAGNVTAIDGAFAPSPSTAWRLNEIGAWLGPGDEPFIETYAEGDGWVSTENLVWTTETEPHPFDWSPLVSDIWWVPAAAEIAWAECPNRLNSVRVLPADLPSLYGDRTVRLGALNAGQRTLLDSVRSDRDRFDAQHRLVPGISWERVHPAQGAWAACLIGSTPGAPNSQSAQVNPTGSGLTVSPRTCAPGHPSMGLLEVSWKGTDRLGALQILDEWGRPVFSLVSESDVVPEPGARGVWIWDGRDGRGMDCEPGIYWVLASDPTKNTIDAEVVVVAPRKE